MSWEWSHTAEAYRDAELNLQALPVDELRIIWGEWKADEPQPDPDYPGDFTTGWHQEAYDAALIEAATMNADELVTDIWTKASDQRTCTNGGHQAWLCPYGCGPHLVGFDRHPDGNDYC